MNDPNDTYKRGFQALTDALGRVPTSRDSGWLALHNEYSRACSELRDIRLAEERKAAAAALVSAAGSGGTGFSRQPAPQARSYTREGEEEGAGEALSGPGAARNIQVAVSEPEPALAPPGDLQGLIEGDRGPGGGLMLRCEGCGRLWERERKRGRPAAKCERCR